MSVRTWAYDTDTDALPARPTPSDQASVYFQLLLKKGQHVEAAEFADACLAGRDPISCSVVYITGAFNIPTGAVGRERLLDIIASYGGAIHLVRSCSSLPFMARFGRFERIFARASEVDWNSMHSSTLHSSLLSMLIPEHGNAEFPGDLSDAKRESLDSSFQSIIDLMRDDALVQSAHGVALYGWLALGSFTKALDTLLCRLMSAQLPKDKYGWFTFDWASLDSSWRRSLTNPSTIQILNAFPANVVRYRTEFEPLVRTILVKELIPEIAQMILNYLETKDLTELMHLMKNEIFGPDIYRMVGECLPKNAAERTKNKHPDLPGKITGMILEHPDLFDIAASPEMIQSLTLEAIDVLAT